MNYSPWSLRIINLINSLTLVLIPLNARCFLSSQYRPICLVYSVWEIDLQTHVNVFVTLYGSTHLHSLNDFIKRIWITRTLCRSNFLYVPCGNILIKLDITREFDMTRLFGLRWWNFTANFHYQAPLKSRLTTMWLIRLFIVEDSLKGTRFPPIFFLIVDCLIQLLHRLLSFRFLSLGSSV
jgi:hypothetical protein